MSPHRRSMGAFLAGLLLVAAMPAQAEIVVQNAVGIPVTIQYGYADANGFVEWTPLDLEPCFTVTFKEAATLRMLFPSFLDGRLNPDTGTIAYEVLLLNQAGTIALFAADPRIMYDVFPGRSICDTAPPAKPVPTN